MKPPTLKTYWSTPNGIAATVLAIVIIIVTWLLADKLAGLVPLSVVQLIGDVVVFFIAYWGIYSLIYAVIDRIK